jgi:uncharacterized protein YjlB
VARGRARVVLGGAGGPEIELEPGDVVVLPAGTGHRCLSATPDFLVVGAYPPDQSGAISRPPATPEDLQRIAALPAPATDPVTGEAWAWPLQP